MTPAERDGAARRDVVVVGVGQLRHNRARSSDEALEPLALLERAARAAADDAGDADLLATLDAVGVVQIVSWTYTDAARELADAVGARPATTAVSGAGGHQPVALLAELAEAIAAGAAETALLAGAEAQSSLDALDRSGVEPGWSRRPGGPGRFGREVAGTERMWDLGLVGPVRVYPLFENRFRHDTGLDFDRGQDLSARLYARFSEIAAGNEASWNPEIRSADEIRTVTADNRMICHPYPLRMNAVNRVDQAAAVLLMSTEAADRAGVPEERRVHLWSVGTADDSECVLDRPGYGASAGMAASLDDALAAAGVGIDDVETLDLYSCFPVVPEMAAAHLGVDGRDLTQTGGLTSFGGAHNDYATHALVATVRALRARGGLGLVYANGEYVTRHATAVLAAARRSGGFVRPPHVPAPDTPGATVDDTLTGDVEVETFTVEYERDGSPARGYVIVRSDDGRRSGVRVSRSDAATLAFLTAPAADPIGRPGVVSERDGRRLFAVQPEGAP